MTDGGSKAEDFFQLELDGVFEVFNFIDDLLSFVDGEGMSLELDKDVSNQLSKLLEESIRGNQDIILFGPFLDFVLVLVESLETISINGIDSSSLSFFDVNDRSNNANLHSKMWLVGESNRSLESFVFFGIVIPETNLQLDGLNKLPLFFGCQHLSDGLL